MKRFLYINTDGERSLHLMTHKCKKENGIKYQVLLDMVCAATSDLSALRLCWRRSLDGLIRLRHQKFPLALMSGSLGSDIRIC